MKGPENLYGSTVAVCSRRDTPWHDRLRYGISTLSRNRAACGSHHTDRIVRMGNRPLKDSAIFASERAFQGPTGPLGGACRSRHDGFRRAVLRRPHSAYYLSP